MANPSLSPVIPATSQLESLDRMDSEPVPKKQPANPKTTASQLTAGELNLMASIAAGDSHREMAGALSISEDVLASELAGLCRKLNVANELELILFALHHQLLETVDTHKEAPSQA